MCALVDQSPARPHVEHPHRTPAVSIVIPCYNGASWLDETLASLAGQSCADWEAVVVDDGSTDESAQIARRWHGGDRRVRLVQQANAGLPAARNAGVRESRGRYLVFLDADDLLEPEFLMLMRDALEGEPEAMGIACSFTVIEADGSTFRQELPGSGEWLTIDDILPANGWPPHAAMIRRELFEEVGGFNPALRSVEDWDFWLRSLAGSDFLALRRPLVRYRKHPGQMSSNHARMAECIAQVADDFARRHSDVIAQYGRLRFRFNIALLLVVQSAKALKTGHRAMAIRISLKALWRAPWSIQLVRRLAILWLPASATRMILRLKGKSPDAAPAGPNRPKKIP